eukprot:scaffold48909_cov25-Tisochrysis_lutea.AAC.2
MHSNARTPPLQFTARKGSIKISHKWMGFTQRQDLKLSAGLDVSWPTKANEPTSVSVELEVVSVMLPW